MSHLSPHQRKRIACGARLERHRGCPCTRRDRAHDGGFVQHHAPDQSFDTGRRLNEDTYSVQIIDSEERLVSLMKSDLKEYTVLKTSTMPSFKNTLTAMELDDVVTYLRTLKGAR